MLSRVAAAAAAALLVCACAQPVKPIHALSPEAAAQASVGRVVITNHAANVPGDGIQALQTALEQGLAQCATGPTKYDMQVRLDNFKLANSGMVMLLGDSHEVSAEVKLVKPDDGSVVGEYYVQERTYGGGLVGLAILSGGSRAISTDFTKSVCEKVFGKKK